VLEDERALFTGDVVIGTGTVVIAPPGGEMRTYQRTLRRLRDEYGDATAIYGGHGPEITGVHAKLDEYIAHRELRERQVVDALDAGVNTIPQLVERIYAGVDRRLWPAAARQVLAYLLALESEGGIRAERITREPTAEESALLNPDLSKLAGRDDADVVRAELGYGAVEPLLRYVRK
jgi:glyoxylase-like metal-dependent hydrolase (beta-lactamase superfamily II)